MHVEDCIFLYNNHAKKNTINHCGLSSPKNVHTEKSFRNLIKSNRNQIVFTIFRLIWHQKDVRLVPNQSENGEYNRISVSFNMISK